MVNTYACKQCTVGSHGFTFTQQLWLLLQGIEKAEHTTRLVFWLLQRKITLSELVLQVYA